MPETMNKQFISRRVWRTVRQNVQYEIESAESEIAIHRSQLKEESADAEQVLAQCDLMVQRARAANCFFPLGELLIYQLLLEVRRNLLLVQSIEEVEAKWSTIRSQLPDLAKSGSLNSDDETKKMTVDTYFSERQKTIGKVDLNREKYIRHQVKAFKALSDNRVIDNAWRTIFIRRYTWGLGFLVICLVCLMMVMMGFETDGPVWPHIASVSGPSELKSKQLEALRHSLLLCVVASIIGGCISTLTSLEEPQAAGPPLAKITVARPIVAGVAGLVVWAVASTAGSPLQMPYPSLYVIALAFGFSERLFLGGLAKIAERAESQLGEATGQSKPK